MKSQFVLRENDDLCLLPYSPLYENQTVEIRAQAKNEGAAVPATFHFYLDDRSVAEKTVFAEKNAFAFAAASVKLCGRAGTHTVTVTVTAGDDQENKTSASCSMTVLKKPLPLLDGGFLMLGPPNDRAPTDLFRATVKSLTDEDWHRYVREMKSIGMDSLVIFDSVQFLTIASQKVVAHYPSSLLPKSDITAEDPIAAILSEAKQTGQKVFLGLGNPYGYEGAAREMTELMARYGKYSSFYGWYFAAEVVMSSTAPEEMVKWDYYEKLYDCAHRLAPVKPVVISPMAIPCREVLRHIRKKQVFDIIMPQDWVGGEGHTLRQSKIMHKKLKAFCRKTGKHLWANCESFNWKDGVLVPRYHGGGMVGEKGFDKQLKTARPYAEKLLSFALTGFWCPPNFLPCAGGAEAVKQHEDYVNYRNQTKN